MNFLSGTDTIRWPNLIAYIVAAEGYIVSLHGQQVQGDDEPTRSIFLEEILSKSQQPQLSICRQQKTDVYDNIGD